MTRPHRHMIIAYAESPEDRVVECRLIICGELDPDDEWGEWGECGNPLFTNDIAYRFADDPHRVSFPDGWRDMRPKLYQKRVEIPVPLTVEEAAECDGVLVPYVGTTGPGASRYFKDESKIAFAKQGLAYRTREEATTRARGWVETEGE